MLPALRLTTVAVMAPARSEATKAAVSATSARVGSRFSTVPCSRSAWNSAGVTPAAALIAANFATASAAAGVTPAEFQALLEQGTVLKRLPTLAEVADTAAFLASDRAGAMTATVANLSAGSIVD